MNSLSFGSQFYIWNGGKTLVLEQTPKGNDVDALRKFVTSQKPSDETIDEFIKQTDITEAQNQTASGPKGKEEIARSFFDSFNKGELVDINIQHVNDQRDETEQLPINSFLNSYHIRTIQKPVQEESEKETEKRVLLTANRLRKNTNKETLIYIDKKGNLFDGREGEYSKVHPITKRFYDEFTKELKPSELISIHNHPVNHPMSIPDVQCGLMHGNTENIVITPNGTLFRLKLPALPIKERSELSNHFSEYTNRSKQTAFLREIINNKDNLKYLNVENELEGFDQNSKTDAFMLVLALLKLKKEHNNLDIKFSIEKLPENIDDPKATEFKIVKLFELD